MGKSLHCLSLHRAVRNKQPWAGQRCTVLLPEMLHLKKMLLFFFNLKKKTTLCIIMLQSAFIKFLHFQADHLLIPSTSCIPALQCQCSRVKAQSLSSDWMIKVLCDWAGQGGVWEQRRRWQTGPCAFIVLLGTVVNVLSQQDVLLCTSVYCVAASGLKLKLLSLWSKQCPPRYPHHRLLAGTLLYFKKAHNNVTPEEVFIISSDAWA